MKKRRELDALVTNGKLPRRKSRSGHELLRSNDSDSSEVEEFSVPLGKISDKKWNGWCPCQSCIALLVFVVMASCLIACGGLVWMHFELKQDFDNLRERLNAVETRNLGTPEQFQKYHSQMQALNKTVHDIKSGSWGVDTLNRNIKDITQQLTKLTATTTTLRESIQTAPELKDLPKQFATLTSSVASMGSEMESAKTRLDGLSSFQKSTTQQLDLIKKRVENIEKSVGSHGPLTPTPGKEAGSAVHTDNAGTSIDVIGGLHNLQLDIAIVNRSLIAQLDAINSTLVKQQTRLTLLEKFTSQLSSTSPTGSTTKLHETNVADMLDSLQDMYYKLQADIVNVNMTHNAMATDHQLQQDFIQFKANASSNLEHLSSSIASLSGSVDQIAQKYVQSRTELATTNAHIQGILHFLGRQFPPAKDIPDLRNATTNTPPLPTVGVTSKPTEGVTNKPTEGVTSKPTEGVTGKPTDGLTDHSSTTNSVPVQSTKVPSPILKIATIKNMKDLRTYFLRWDKGSGRVDPQILQDYMADPPTPAQLAPFDANHDGKYTMDELANALGFNTTETQTKKEINTS